MHVDLDCHIGGSFSAVKNSWNFTKLNSDLDHCEVEISVHLFLLNPSKSGASRSFDNKQCSNRAESLG